MGLNDTPSAERIHIAFFGRTNAGKSSLMNRLTGQEISLVSEMKGTTTDPVHKVMELLPIGPIVVVDTPGMEDSSQLGKLRMDKTIQILRKTDIAVLVVDSTIGICEWEQEWIQLLKQRQIPFLVVWNKMDLVQKKQNTDETDFQVYVSALHNQGFEEFKNALGELAQVKQASFLVGDLLNPMDRIVMVVPIDGSAPKGRIILPQQQVLREALDAGAVVTVVRDLEYVDYMAGLSVPPKLVVTDSQVFGFVESRTPDNIMLTSFSILMARKKGFLRQAVEGVQILDSVKDGDKILIAEGCTHHRQCGDIGSVKLPKWIREYTKAKPEFDICSGMDFPEDLTGYRLVIHCGGCMLNPKEIQARMQIASRKNIPFTNYGIAIAHMNHILDRSIQILKDKEF